MWTPQNFKLCTFHKPPYANWHFPDCHLCHSSMLRLFITGAQTWYMQMLYPSDINCWLHQKQDSQIRTMFTCKGFLNEILPFNIYSLLFYWYKILCNFWHIVQHPYWECLENRGRSFLCTMLTTSYMNRVTVVNILSPLSVNIVCGILCE